MDRTALAWWAALGVGLGLVLLSTVLWLRQGSPDEENLAFSRELARIEPVLLQLHRGELPSPENLDKSRTGEFEPLMRALMDAARQRQQALEAYQSQVEAVSLGDWLTPANLAAAKGRQNLRTRLHELDAALESLIKRDASVQSRLDEALSEWLAQQPASVRADQARRRLLQASTPAAHVMTTFFKVERDIVAQVSTLLDHLDNPAVQLALETRPQPELIFRREQDLSFYRETLTRLSVLGERESQLIEAARKAPEQQAKLVGAWLVARSDERR